MDIENKDLILEGIKKGVYNLYLGAGAVHECKNTFNKKLPLGEELRDILSKKYNKTARSLFQMATLINTDDLNETLQEEFNLKELSTAIECIPHYVWKRIFTLNVDDAIETAYSTNSAKKQDLLSCNFTDSFYLEPDIQKLQIVHLHGFIKKPEDGYVFNANEYIQNIKGNNTWMTVFSEYFSSDSFIMSGLSSNEEDVNYYLSFRSISTQKPGLYPSILIEPYPNDFTIKMCEKHNLQLIKATFDEFMFFLADNLKNVPTVYDLVSSPIDILDGKTEKEKLHFYSEFEVVTKKKQKTAGLSPFDYGFEPEMLDILSDKDIHRSITDDIVNDIISKSKKRQKYGDLFLISGKYLNGKTTTALRVLNYFINQDFYVFRLKSLRGFNVENTIACIQSLDRPCIFYIDNLAEYIHNVNELLLRCSSLVVLGTERNYRLEHIKRVLVSHVNIYNCDEITNEESEKLVQKYLSLGRIQNRTILQKKANLRGYTIGEQVCIILDFYEPIQKKIEDLFKNDSQKEDLKALLLIAICCYCYKQGVNYFLIRSILPSSYDFNKFFKIDSYFKLEFNKDDLDYVLPRNKLYFTQLIEYYLKNNRELVKKYYTEILKKISPFVNRKTIMLHTPESKLLARMLDVDKNVKYFFLSDVQKFMEDIKPMCEWNSRYWEQRALSLVDADIDTAISYAKTAVSIEFHPYPLTTLSKIFFSKMKTVSGSEKTSYCIKALTECLNAMKEEGKRRMESIHPLLNLISGLSLYMRSFATNESLPDVLRRNVYSAIDTYEQEISLSVSEKNTLEKIKQYLL